MDPRQSFARFSGQQSKPYLSGCMACVNCNITIRLYDKTVILAYLSGKKGRMRDNNSIYGEQYLLLFNQQQFSKSTIVFLYITIH